MHARACIHTRTHARPPACTHAGMHAQIIDEVFTELKKTLDSIEEQESFKGNQRKEIYSIGVPGEVDQ